ncbi:ATP-binding protein [Streptomyces altiplanensis]
MSGTRQRSLQKYFDPAPQSVALARNFTVTALSAWGLKTAADDIRLCVSELASNALTHGSRHGHGFLVRLATEEDFVRLEVHDSRNRHECERLPLVHHPSETETSGRGLLIVEMLAADWGIEDRQPYGKVIWSHFKTIAGGSPA